MLVRNIASLVVAREKTCGCYGTNMQKIWRKSFFDTRLELLGWEIGENDGKKNSSAYLPHVPCPLGTARYLFSFSHPLIISVEDMHEIMSFIII